MVGCSAGSASNNMMAPSYSYPPEYNNEYLELNEKGFINTEINNKVNLSLDSSTAAYSNIRKLINMDYPISENAVNIEQMLNYFNYAYENNTDEQLTSFMEIANCPWNDENYLLSVAVKAKEFRIDNQKPNNFVFLLDVSGSMYSADKLPLMQNAFKLLVDNLNDNDRISIVTYAGSDDVVLDGAYGFEKTKISAAISDLSAGGSTNGSAGIKTAYNIASKYYIQDGNNRVFLATDGDFNVGITSNSSLEQFISEKRETGIYLSCFGFGYGNLKSDKMDTLSQKGNGNYYYIDSILEAQKVFINELGGTLQTVAKDTKVQVEFNSNVVSKYRVIGYENKILTDDQFNDSKTDAGEIGAGHTTVAIIEFSLKDVDYDGYNIASCILRYKDVLKADEEKEIISKCNVISNAPSTDFKFQAAICEFGLLLRDSEYKGNANIHSLYERINKDEFKTDIYRREFIGLINLYINNRHASNK